jgi:serine/threonine protein kinase
MSISVKLRYSLFLYPQLKLEDIELDKNEVKLDKDEDGDPVELGQGSMGVVYRGQYRSANVAVKKINVSGLPVAATAKELKMYCLLSHPNIVRIFGHYTKKPYLFLVLELGSKNLRAFLESRSADRLSFSEALPLALHISNGIMYLHSQDIIHLDIKSSNVIICDGNVAKIADLGSARKMITTTTQSTLGQSGCGRYTLF